MLEIILTLGPASSEEKVILSLLEAAGRFRLNTSHMDIGELELWLTKLEKIFYREKHRIPVVIDLQGSKMRIGQYPSIDSIPDKVFLFYGDFSDSIHHIPVPHKALFNVLKYGDIISLNDGKVLLIIINISGSSAEAKVIRNGKLSSNKGLNRKVHPVPFEALTQKDMAMIKTSIHYDFTEFAFSFAHNGSEAEKIRPYIEGHKLIAKVERPETMKNLDSIDRKFDEIWFCRGDLGAQAGIFELGRLQEAFSSKIPGLNKPCVIAGQVLEHMTNFKEPTHSEIVHLYDIEKKGFKGFVLSDETAAGKNPIAVAEFLKSYKSSTASY